MRYRIRHETSYAYGHPVSICHNQLRLTPRAGRFVKVLSAKVNINPAPTTQNTRLDSFGNRVHVFSIEHAHDDLHVVAQSEVEVSPRPTLADTSVSPSWRGIKRAASRGALRASAEEVDAYLFDSPYVRRSHELAEYAREIFAPWDDIFSACVALTTRVFLDFAYDPEATGVQTDSTEAFALKRGVCQDLAHVQIAALRSLGIPARYVSGYLRTLPPEGQPRLIGADQSHAWLAVYCGQELGWVDLDPTNNLVVQTDHVPLAYGRDYADITPVRGVYIGGGQNTLGVSVDVEPVFDVVSKT